jgi:hypothetical protein
MAIYYVLTFHFADVNIALSKTTKNGNQRAAATIGIGG